MALHGCAEVHSTAPSAPISEYVLDEVAAQAAECMRQFTALKNQALQGGCHCIHVGERAARLIHHDQRLVQQQAVLPRLTEELSLPPNGQHEDHQGHSWPSSRIQLGPS